MLKLKAWHGAIIIAVLFHISCFSLFNIKVIARKSNYQSGYKTMSTFLGQILEDIKSASFAAGLPSANISFRKDMVNLDNFPKSEQLPRSFVPEPSINPPDKLKDMQFDFRILTKGLELDFINVKNRINYSDFSGPLSERKLIFKPCFPVAPAWAKDSGKNFKARFKVWVSSDGAVVFLDRLASSGYTDIDLLFGKYILGMHFQRTSDKPLEWGLLEVKF